MKKRTFFAELAMSQRWSAIFCATGVLGGKPIGRVRVKEIQAEDVQKYFLSYYVILINIIFYSSIISLILGLELFHYTKIFKNRMFNADGYFGSTQETIFSSVLKMNRPDANCAFSAKKIKNRFLWFLIIFKITKKLLFKSLPIKSRRQRFVSAIFKSAKMSRQPGWVLL